MRKSLLPLSWIGHGDFHPPVVLLSGETQKHAILFVLSFYLYQDPLRSSLSCLCIRTCHMLFMSLSPLPSEFLEGKHRMFSSLCSEYQLDDTHPNTSHWLLFIPRLCWSRLNTSDSFNYPSSQQGDTGFFFLPPSNRSTNGVKEGKLDHIMFLWQKLYFQISCCVVRVMK